ncbi:MAG: LptF/LptG family permease [Gemmatimonadales bacterium]
MRIVSRYLLKQHAAPFIFSLLALTGFMLLNQIAKRLPQLVGKGLHWTVIVEFFALTVPYLIAMTLSMSVLLAVLHTFSRLANDSEITAFRAGGVSLLRLIRPVLFAAAVVTAIAFVFGDQILPRTNHKLRVLMTDIGRTKPTFSLKEHVINEVQPGRVFLRAAHIDRATYDMRDVTIYRTANMNSTSIIYADSGRMAFAPNHEDLQLILFSGSVHDFDRSNPGLFQRTSYQRYLILLSGVGSEFVRRQGDNFHGDRELGVCELEKVAQTARRNEWLAAERAHVIEMNGLRVLVGLPTVEPDTIAPRRRASLYCRLRESLLPQQLEAQQTPQHQPGLAHGPRRLYVTARPRQSMSESRMQADRARGSRIRAAVYWVEFHKKYSIPAACIVFVLVGVPVALKFPHSGLGMVIGVGMGVFGIYYIALIGGESLANQLKIPPALAMWLPNMVFGLLGTVGLWRLSRQGVARSGSPLRGTGTDPTSNLSQE